MQEPECKPSLSDSRPWRSLLLPLSSAVLLEPAVVSSAWCRTRHGFFAAFAPCVVRCTSQPPCGSAGQPTGGAEAERLRGCEPGPRPCGPCAADPVCSQGLLSRPALSPEAGCAKRERRVAVLGPCSVPRLWPVGPAGAGAGPAPGVAWGAWRPSLEVMRAVTSLTLASASSPRVRLWE